MRKFIQINLKNMNFQIVENKVYFLIKKDFFTDLSLKKALNYFNVRFHFVYFELRLLNNNFFLKNKFRK
jgi:hypothetical protein